MLLRAASYNIHGCVGRDGVRDPDRIRAVLRSLRADVVALQEVEDWRDEPGLLDYFCLDSAWRPVYGPTMARPGGPYGNALLTALPIRSVQKLDISVTGREPRGALFARLDHPASPVEVLATHLGLRPAERRAQIRKLLEFLAGEVAGEESGEVTLLLGDLNEWFAWGRPLRWLKRHFSARGSVPATYPAGWPLLALDRIWVHPRDRLQRLRTVRTGLTRVASDHLPLVAEIAL